MTEREPVTAEALGALYAKYWVSLTATARHALRTRGVPESVVSAEDIVQNAFTKALRDPAAVDHPISYLRVVIRREVANRARQRAEHSRLEARRAADPVRFDPAQSPDIADLVADRCAVERALAGLTLQQRTAVWATKALDLTQHETAVLMDRAPGTVATHVSRSMALLRASLVAAVVAAIVCVAGRLIGGRLHRTDPAREPGEGTGTSPARWWHDGWAAVVEQYERWPEAAALSLLAAIGILWWAVAWRRRCLTSRSEAFPGTWLSLGRTRRVWLTAIKHKLGRAVRLELSDGPSREQRLTPNVRLHDLFRLAGWSRSELVRLVNRQAAAMGHPHLATDTSRVGKRQVGGSLPWAPERTATILTEFTGTDLLLNRRGSVGAGAALTTGTALSGTMLGTPAAHPTTREALKILEVVTHAPHGVVSRAQIAHSLKTFGTAEAAALAMLVRQGYLRQLSNSRWYTTGQDLGGLVAVQSRR